MEPESSCPATIQPINRIRVWGIGLENERDFGYVARDPATKKHKCHVFRCDMPARAVAKALLDNHQKMSRTQSHQPQGSAPLVGGATGKENGRHRTDMLAHHEQSHSRAMSPPSRMVETGETMACTYVGSCEVPRALGIDVLNEAVDKLRNNKSNWINVNLTIATSNIRITKSERTLYEHRVRFLCFLGIAKDDRFCGYILESNRSRHGDKKFQFHGFKMEPNTDRLCLALHSACQARYQRVLDSNPDARTHERESDRVRSKSTSSILGRLGSFKKNRKDEDCKVFHVQYLGSQQVSKSEGLEVVKVPIQQLSPPRSSIPNSPPINLVEFEISQSGLSMTDPQKRLFSKKNFSTKYITYVVRIRNYFAFVVREGGKYQCYVFLEADTDAATIVTTIQRMLAPEPVKKR